MRCHCPDLDFPDLAQNWAEELDYALAKLQGARQDTHTMVLDAVCVSMSDAQTIARMAVNGRSSREEGQRRIPGDLQQRLIAG